jgi:2'-5' RNA ligase
MRLFACLPFPAHVQEQIADYAHSLVPAFDRAHPAWVPQENLHLTLHFFGEVEAQTAAALQGLLEEAARLCPALHLATGKLSALPSMRSPRVLYIAMDIQPAEALAKLVDRMRAVAAQIGAETEARPWKAHLTLARLKTPLMPELSSLPAPPGLTFSIDAFELMQSRLKPSGAVYSPLKHYPLAGS